MIKKKMKKFKSISEVRKKNESIEVKYFYCKTGIRRKLHKKYNPKKKSIFIGGDWQNILSYGLNKEL